MEQCWSCKRMMPIESLMLDECDDGQMHLCCINGLECLAVTIDNAIMQDGKDINEQTR